VAISKTLCYWLVGQENHDDWPRIPSSLMVLGGGGDMVLCRELKINVADKQVAKLRKSITAQ
jgi:hypothetical protein